MNTFPEEKSRFFKYDINPKSNVNQVIGNIGYIVFDMDECIGSIHGYSYLLEILTEANERKIIDNNAFNQYYEYMLNNLYENYEIYQFLRPGIIEVLTLVYFFKVLLEGRLEIECIIYTNNGLEPLVKMVVSLINKIVGYKVINGYVYRNSKCKIDIGPIGKMTKRLEHLQRCYSSNMNSNNTLFFDNDSYSVFKNELGRNYIQVSPYYYYNSINLYNYYNNHIRFILVNRSYIGIFGKVESFRDFLEVYINDLMKGERVIKSNFQICNINKDSFTLIIPSIFNFLGVKPNGNKDLLNYLAVIYLGETNN
jgi:hypothetical protein